MSELDVKAVNAPMSGDLIAVLYRWRTPGLLWQLEADRAEAQA